MMGEKQKATSLAVLGLINQKYKERLQQNSILFDMEKENNLTNMN